MDWKAKKASQEKKMTEPDRDCCLGIDTSNYKTSVAVTDADGHVIFDSRRFLQVKKGMRGLRQSEALFQHVNALPEIIGKVKTAEEGIWRRICCVAVSSRPRPVEGSYMPAFLPGVSAARSVAEALEVPCYEFSHQEGHIEAVRYRTPLKDSSRFVCFHFSGGTTEAVLVDNGTYTIAGGTKDISFGQLLDRTGVMLGMDFPCGEEMDSLASDADMTENDKKFLSDLGFDDFKIKKIKVNGGFINLSGAETYTANFISGMPDRAQMTEEQLILVKKKISSVLFDVISETIAAMTLDISKEQHVSDFLFAGGVSASRNIRKSISRYLDGKVTYYFGDPGLSTDNAVGISLLGGRKYRDEANNSNTAE
jgi:N6-L-threonylcarbamoyladenine synthase